MRHWLGEAWSPIADALLTTDDPAAVAAIAAQWWERHPDAVLDAGVAAGVLDEEIAKVNYVASGIDSQYRACRTAAPP